ncbi:hypothetical protein A4X13_0g5249 [Tilletia indica]|uniref:Reverse transcriptase domain-containing protein n=1 Tax=Tilletia indica TaxID=43049 RepID=A0A8T8SV74_9BASI|nr:hypothetical protein A4X13_0g5249 [Tilletia indica]
MSNSSTSRAAGGTPAPSPATTTSATPWRDDINTAVDSVRADTSSRFDQIESRLSDTNANIDGLRSELATILAMLKNGGNSTIAPKTEPVPETVPFAESLALPPTVTVRRPPHITTPAPGGVPAHVTAAPIPPSPRAPWSNGPGYKQKYTETDPDATLLGPTIHVVDDINNSSSFSQTLPDTNNQGGTAPIPKGYTIKTSDIGTFDGTPEDLELFIARVEAIYSSESDSNWKAAVLRAMPLLLHGHAASWHQTLEATSRASLINLSAWFKVLRESFSPDPNYMRRLARERTWQVDREDIVGYVLDKTALLKAAFVGIPDREIVYDILAPISVAIRKQLPTSRHTSLTELRNELRMQELFAGPSPTVPPAQTVATSATPVSSAKRSISTSSTEARRPKGKPIAEDFDSSRLAYAIEPKRKRSMMRYKIPGTDVVLWCQRPCSKCQGPHFDFAHDFCATNTVPSINAMGVDADDYLVSTEAADDSDFWTSGTTINYPHMPTNTGCGTHPVAAAVREDQGRQDGTPVSSHDDGHSPDELVPARARHSPPHHQGGCKSGGERAVPPPGPTGGLSTGYRDGAAMSGDGEGSGPPLCLRPSGYVTREVDLPPAVRDDEHIDDPDSPSPSIQREQPKELQLFFADRPQLRDPRNLSVPESAQPLSHPTKRGGCTVVALARHPDVGTGQAYRSHVPLSAQIRINDTEGTPVSSLLDTGASLSTIDATLFRNLGGTPSGHPIRVNGIGATETEGWATITFFLAARDSHGREVLLECSHDFHILPNFLPGLCLGLDFIQHHAVSIDVRHDRALIGRYTFPVTEKLPAPYAKEAELCSSAAFHVPARSSAWIPIDSACLAPGVDYTIHPRCMHTADHRVQIAGPTAIRSHGLSYVLITNVGTQAINLPRRTPIADASVARLGETFVEAAHTFTLESPMPAGATMASMAAGDAWTAEGTEPTEEEGLDADVAAPLDLFEGTVDASHDLARDAATTLVDDQFKVGVDEVGVPPPAVVELLRRHRDAFALDGRPGLIRDEEMTIPLQPDASLRSEPPRRASPEKRAAMDSAIEQLLAWDVIEPSSSPISFPVLMVRQYNKWRFCVDYRQLNAVTVADRYSLPTTDSVFHTLMGKSWFSSLDAIRGYHQMPVKTEDRWKTAFVCHRGLYQYKTVPFGLRNAPAVFQRLMDKILGALRWKEAVIYIDDTVVATETLEEHVAALETLLTRATAAGLKFSPAKCTFAVPSLVLLGRNISGAGIAVWDERARAVHDLPRPRTLQDLYHALGLFGYYRIFIEGFAALAEPLTRLTRGWRYESVDGRTRLVNQKGETASASQTILEWGPEQDDSFRTLKRMISSAPVLAHPDPSRPYVLYVDASKFAFAAAFHQVFAEVGPDLPVPRSRAHLNTLEFAALPSDVAKERWSSWVRADPVFRSLFHRAQTSTDSEWLVRDGVLLRRTDGRIALPEAALAMVLRDAHDHRGHFGSTKTFLAVSRRFWRLAAPPDGQCPRMDSSLPVVSTDEVGA